MIVIADEVTALNAANAEYPVIGYDNMVTTANISATTSATGFPATNLANPSTHPPWKGATASPLATEYITISMAGLRTISYLAVADHNFGTIGAALTVEVIDPGFSPDLWTAINYGSPASYSPTDDSPIIFQFTPKMYLGVRLKIEPGTAVPQAGVVYCGELLTLERSVRVNTTHTPIPMGRRSDIASGRSENGKFLGRIVLGQWSEGQADFEFFTSDWYRTYFKPFVDASDETPFFFAWSPVDHPEDVGYVWMREDPIAEVNTMVDRIGISIKYQGIVT